MLMALLSVVYTVDTHAVAAGARYSIAIFISAGSVAPFESRSNLKSAAAVVS